MKTGGSESASGLFLHPDLGRWSLAPEGAAVHRAERTAVIADVHLGYEWARASGGDMIPAHSLAETIAKLERLLARAPIARLIVAGDLVEAAGPCARTARDVLRLVAWLGGLGVALVWLKGNHDPPRRPALPSSIVVDGWTIAHGDRKLADGRVIFGHHHPAMRAEGLSAPSFLIGAETIALPAFSPNAAGLDVRSRRLPATFRREPLRCVAGLGAELLDFGPLKELAGTIVR